MAIDVKKFGGILNSDDKELDIAPNQHIDARNVRLYGGREGLTLENVKGNYVIANSNLPAGTNECVGAFYDQVKRRIIWFNYNSNGNNGIYQLDIQTETVTQIFRCGVNSATDILTFNLNYPVHSVAIVYRTEGDGDLLYWTDGNNRPRYLNLDTVSTLSPFTEAMINAGKDAPTKPPGSLSFQDDVTTYFNAVRNKLFRFAYRWVYVNGEKSTFSPTSITPLTAVLNPNEESDPTVDNYIQFDVYSGATEDNEAIEVFGQISNGTTWGDFFIIDSLNLSEYGIALDSSYTYKFYNNGSYIFVDPTESDLYFDWLPDKANTLETLNGNVIIYGGITEGYPNLTRAEVDVTITSSLTTASGFDTYAWKWGSNQRFGLVYFDARGKTNGVISFITDSAVDTTDFSVTTPNYTSASLPGYGQVPKINASINHTPPTWAVAYQWVRVNLTPKFLHWVTNDFQQDDNYLYLCIQNLVEFNTSNGFLPSYEFAQGDRVRIIANVPSNGTSTVFSTQQDYPILEVVDRIMSSPATTGKFIKVPKLTSPSPGYSAHLFIEVYTPLPRTPSNQQLFYEWGQRYAIYTLGGDRYHRGQTQDQTGSQPALFEWTDGDVYVKYRNFYLNLPVTGTTAFTYLYMMDANWNDYVPTASNSNGRAWTINENAATVYNPVLLRWGGLYQQGTNLNALNRFRPADFDEADRAKGDIRRFKARDRILRVFQDRATGQYGIYARFIQNNEGVNDLVTTNEIITTNNIQYYSGTYGLSGYPTNLVSTQNADYFQDVVTGRAIRLSGDGMTDLGLLYKGQYYLSGLVTPYNKDITRSNGSKAKVMGFFDYLEGQYHTILQAGTNAGTTYSPYNFSFNELRNAFCSQYDYHPEWAIGAEDKVYTWKDGAIWRHNSDTYCNFYGSQYNASITLVFNPNVGQKKNWQSVAEVASGVWECPLIYTDVKTYGSQRQESTLVPSEFTILEGMPTAAFKRDQYSVGGKWNGQFLKGQFIAVKFQKTNALNLISLNEIVVLYIESPLNIS